MDAEGLRSRLTEEELLALVQDFYAKVQGDELLAPVFASRIAEHEWPEHLGRMRDFWSTMLLGAGTFRGHPMRVHLGLEGVGPEHFDRWLSLFAEVVERRYEQELASALIETSRRMGAHLLAGRMRMGR